MIPEVIKQFVYSLHNHKISGFSSVPGGSINNAFRYYAGKEEFFLKFNQEVEGIIEKEVDGLKAISKLNCISTPKVIAFQKVESYELLVLPFIKEGIKTSRAWEAFGEQLAEMHSVPVPYYGWHQNNFIGSLPQSNEQTDNFPSFFINQRLRPQIQLAHQNTYFSSKQLNLFDVLFQKLPEILPDTKPSLVHGDLWSGNFMIDEVGIPYLIDPSIHYNYRESDLAFTYLFGGFDSKFYEAYNQHFPLEAGFAERIPLYNIYPLLVHLNIFGTGYLGSVMNNLYQYVR
ncbi:fructosamine kinase family protein [Marivirga harenae]|uniref:fructosamine kinase family protein n=1 Tax=Marivirga harenae TaxID=2010992 RepID=UPI0026DF8E78|nr:fructosamine kinase family protein [Marivirga harenae]WKV11999.1 fructosamine kinase family protein [Marivirga harenae]